MCDTIEMSMDAWAVQFKPVQNHFNLQASFSWGDEKGCLFETYGVELEYVRQMFQSSPNSVWTLMDVDGQCIIGDGMHFVNRLGYFITEVPYDENNIYNIVDEEQVAETET